MTLVDTRRLFDHRLRPDNIATPARKPIIRNGWRCVECDTHWDELPPVAERLGTCPTPH